MLNAYQLYVHYLHIKSSVLRKYYICQTQFNYRYCQDQYCDLFHLVYLCTYAYIRTDFETMHMYICDRILENLPSTHMRQIK